MDLWHVSCLPSPHLFSHISYLNYFKVTHWHISMWWKRAHSSHILCSVVTPDQLTPPANVWAQMQGTGRGTKNQGGRKSWSPWSSQDIALLQPFGCLPGATGWEVKLLLLLSHRLWWQHFDSPLWNSYPLVTSDTWHRLFAFKTQSHSTSHHLFHLW